MSAKDKEQRIRDRAYHLWKTDGEPHGRSHDYWAQAEAMEDALAATPSSTVPSDSTATSQKTSEKRKASAPKQKVAKAETSAAAPPAKPARRTRTPAPKG